MREPLRTVQWIDGRLVLIDQTRLPEVFTHVSIQDVRQLVSAIQSLVVRGAPAIGAAGAYGVVIAIDHCRGDRNTLDSLTDSIRKARPTAVNLSWAVDRVSRRIRPFIEIGDFGGAREAALKEAHAIAEEDVIANRRMAENGLDLIPDGARILTHCNAGELATVSGGTALGVILNAFEQGRRLKVFADETRPRLQGLKLTAWELGRAGVDVEVIPDGAAAFLMRRKMIDLVIVGADRIAANGDTANKIGTYSAAVAARAHGIPFYVAAPVSTIDVNCPSGDAIPIEERGSDEIADSIGVKLPEGAKALNLAFDVTPAEFIAAIVTEFGALRPPYGDAIKRLGVS